MDLLFQDFPIATIMPVLTVVQKNLRKLKMDLLIMVHARRQMNAQQQEGDHLTQVGTDMVQHLQRKAPKVNANNILSHV